MSELSNEESDHLVRMVPTKDSSRPSANTSPTSHDESNNNNNNNPNPNNKLRSRKSSFIDDPASTDPRLLHLADENLLLKKHLRKQEEKIKLLATKLVRIVGERKTKEKRDDMLIDEQKTRILELEHLVANLQDKLQVSRQQLVSYTRLIPHVPLHPPARQPSSSALSTKSSKPKKSLHQNSRPSTAAAPSTGGLNDQEFTSKVEQLLLEAKAENQALEDQLRVTRDRLAAAEKDGDKRKSRIKRVELSHQEELLKLRGQIDVEHDRSKKKKLLSDNIQLIRLQRESRRTSSWLSTMETQCRSLESSLSTANETITQLEAQVSTLQDECRDEQQKSLGLQKSLEDSGSQLSRLRELEAQLKGLLEENAILKQTNESLVDKTLSNVGKAVASATATDPLAKAHDEIRELTANLNELEATLRNELKVKADLKSSLAQEKAKVGQLQAKISELSETIEGLRSELERFKEQVITLKNVPECNPNETEGPEVTRLRKEWQEEIGQAKWQLLQLKEELSKTREFLRTQITINKEYKLEIESLTQKLDRAETFHHEKLQEFMEILEQRAKQMNSLEKTLETIHFNNQTCNQLESDMAKAAVDQELVEGHHEIREGHN